MAFPQTAAPTVTSINSEVDDHNVLMPPVVNAGDLLLVLFSHADDPSTITTPDGWSLLSGGSGSGWYYKVAIGDEDGTTVNFVTADARKAVAQVYRYTAWGGVAATDIDAGTPVADTNDLDPPAVTAGWGSDDNAYLTAIFGGNPKTIIAAPANYGDLVTSVSTGGGGPTNAQVSSARRELAAASDDPAAWDWTGDIDNCVGNTIVIRPFVVQVISPDPVSIQISLPVPDVTPSQQWVLVGTHSSAIAPTDDGIRELPGPPIEGDLVIVVRSHVTALIDSLEDDGQPGWNDISSTTTGSVSFKIMGETPDTEVELVVHGTVWQALIIQVWRGADPAPFPIVVRDNDNGESAFPDSPTITPEDDNTLVFSVAMVRDIDATLVTSPTGYTNVQVQNTTQGEPANGEGATALIASKIVPTQVAEDPSAWEISGSEQWDSWTFAVRPLEAAKTLTPSAMTVPIVLPTPAVALGALTITPNAISVPMVTVAPALALGAIAISPSAVPIPLVVVAPAISLVYTLAPSSVAVPAVVLAPTIAFGAITISSDPITLPLVTAAPVVALAYVISPDSPTIPLVPAIPLITFALAAIISGTVVPDAIASEIVAGGQTIIITLTGTEWVQP